MFCASTIAFTSTLSDDGVVYSFGKNSSGQLGLGYKNAKVSIPRTNPNLPKIKQFSCGSNFTICVDYEGFAWSFGHNHSGQLGSGSTFICKIPHKILNIPPVHSVACGHKHSVIITNDSNLWSCGNNQYGQLGLGNQNDQHYFQETSFFNILRVSLGVWHSLFQNYNGEIISCGYNNDGEVGLGQFKHPQITPTLIPNLPPNIVQFICGSYHTLFLDSEGNVFSVGYNYYGQLGLGHNIRKNTLTRICNIPPIRVISCVDSSSFLIDFDGNVWSFGENTKGILGHGDTTNRNVPTIIENLKDIQTISYGCTGQHVLIKDSQNKIYVTGSNSSGQLGKENTESILIPEEMDPKYFSIWGNHFQSKAKSARK